MLFSSSSSSEDGGKNFCLEKELKNVEHAPTHNVFQNIAYNFNTAIQAVHRATNVQAAQQRGTKELMSTEAWI